MVCYQLIGVMKAMDFNVVIQLFKLIVTRKLNLLFVTSWGSLIWDKYLDERNYLVQPNCPKSYNNFLFEKNKKEFWGCQSSDLFFGRVVMRSNNEEG